MPGTVRRTIGALVLIHLAAVIPDSWSLANGWLPAAYAPLVFGTKCVALGAVSLGVGFGSYRYERVVKRAAAARDLGPYTIVRPLGAGGMGEVFLAEHRLLRRPVAIKRISPGQAGSPDALTRFEREATAVAQLTHPNTVQVFDYGRADDGTFSCVMEYLDGDTLDVLVQRDGPLSVARTVHVLVQLCGALAEAHGRGLVHRDIKPGNVILGSRGGVPDVATLLDFGLVIERTPLTDSDPRVTAAGYVVGTPEYMSPEQCDAESGVLDRAGRERRDAEGDGDQAPRGACIGRGPGRGRRLAVRQRCHVSSTVRARGATAA
jgi:serine/threonine-protein kinase